MDLGGRGGNRTPETEVRGLQPRDTNQQCPLAHVPPVASGRTCDGVEFSLSTTTHPVWLGVGALHPRHDRVSTFRLTGTHRSSLRMGGRTRTLECRFWRPMP